ncbi:Ada metal-binding domain-containing protein [Paraliomyxa miuraensis]|uniref:Ada metal-binding domain-containing protein n=1 Tax=Paraliomyxa miuraensis TaxID=376150 RepID=UPI0022530A39|nr:Ada metal-binding domain-containing protein [Paraliomyxa miuraensis]MCX4243941.1 hypothetical protein [Paraliomyxa miuraensis]
MNRYLGNKNTKEFHDLNNETIGCQIAKIKDRVYFSSPQQAKQAGYDPCAHCLSGSKR